MPAEIRYFTCLPEIPRARFHWASTPAVAEDSATVLVLFSSFVSFFFLFRLSFPTRPHNIPLLVPHVVGSAIKISKLIWLITGQIREECHIDSKCMFIIIIIYTNDANQLSNTSGRFFSSSSHYLHFEDLLLTNLSFMQSNFFHRSSYSLASIHDDSSIHYHHAGNGDY